MKGLSLLCLALVSTDVQAKPPTPQEALRRLFESQLSTPVEMFQARQPFLSSEQYMVRVSILTEKRTKVEVLRPLVHEGSISLDDGKLLRSYQPDQKEIMEQPSPQLFGLAPVERLKLIERNYVLTLADGRTIAGLPTYKVTLRPRNIGVGVRTMYLEQKRYLPLRVEAAERGEPNRILVDTLQVQFNPNPSFSLPSSKDIRVIKMSALRPLDDPEAAADRLGFLHKPPSSLPYGFRIVATHQLTASSGPFLAMRITDGVYSGSIFQWSPKVHRGRNPVNLETMLEDSRDIQYTVFGEIPIGLAKTLLASFVLKLD